MKKVRFSFYRNAAILALSLITATACKKASIDENPDPVSPTLNASDLLGTTWKTTAATLTKPDNSITSLATKDLSQLYLVDVTFLTVPTGGKAGTAKESDFNSVLHWTFNSQSQKLVVYFDVDSLTATVTSMDPHSLVLHRVAPTLEYGKTYASIDQTLTR